MRDRFALPVFAAVSVIFWACSAGSGSGGTDGGSSSSGSSGSSSGGSGSSGSGSGSGSSGGSSGSSSGSCAGGSGDGGSSVTTVCSTTQLGQLTKGDVAQLCNDTVRYFGHNLDEATWCKWEALKKGASSSPMSSSDVQTQCTTNTMACEQSDAGSDAGFPSYVNWELVMQGTNVANCFGGAIDPSCAATIAQYSACIVDETNALVTEVNMFPACSMLQLMDANKVMNAQSMASANPPASCATLEGVCAGLSPPDPSQL